MGTRSQKLHLLFGTFSNGKMAVILMHVYCLLSLGLYNICCFYILLEQWFLTLLLLYLRGKLGVWD